MNREEFGLIALAVGVAIMVGVVNALFSHWLRTGRLI